MRKLIIALMGALGCFVGPALGPAALPALAPLSASAANCTRFVTQPIFWDGQWTFYSYLQGCTDVEAIQQFGSDRPGSSGIYDATHARMYFVAPNSPGHIWYNYPGQNLPESGGQVNHVDVFGPGCGFPPFTAQPRTSWRIKRLATHTWGNIYLGGGDLQTMC